MLLYLLFLLSLFLFVITGFLRGSAKSQLEGFFCLAMLVIAGIGVYSNGWQTIFIYIGIWILGGNFIITPVARRIAKRLIVNPDFGYEEYNRRRLERSIKDFGSPAFMERQAKENEENTRYKSDLISMALRIPAIEQVLKRYNATENDLASFLDCEAVDSLPPRVRKTIMKNDRLLAFYLENSEPCTTYNGSYGRNLSKNGYIRLQIWTHSNPDGEEPRR